MPQDHVVNLLQKWLYYKTANINVKKNFHRSLTTVVRAHAE